MNTIARSYLKHAFFLICASLYAMSAAWSAPASLARNVNTALSDPVLRHGVKGILVKSLDSGVTVYEKNSGMLFIPASNQKLIVSAAALDLLGPDFRFQTSLYLTASPEKGVVKGDVVLVGGGDPVFKHEHLQAMADKTKAMGVKTITGNVVGDDALFDDVRLGWGWAWDDEPYYYSAQISALNLNRNVVEVWVRPGAKPGARTAVRVSPPTGYMTVRNESVTSSAGSSKTVLVDRLQGKNVIRVTGKAPVGYKPDKYEELITVHEPALFACATLKEMLVRHGIEVKGSAVRAAKPETVVPVATHESPPLSEILALLNKPSDNLIAECLLKTLGAKFRSRGSADAGREVALEFLKKTGADLSSVAMEDGSGLSRRNYISPGNLTLLLMYMHRHEHSKVFIDSLPVAGVDGTLRNRMKGTPGEGNVRAKTGYLNRVSSVSGYLTTRAGERLVFSLIMNGHLCRNKEAIEVQDRIINMFVNLSAQSGDSDLRELQ